MLLPLPKWGSVTVVMLYKSHITDPITAMEFVDYFELCHMAINFASQILDPRSSACLARVQKIFNSRNMNIEYFSAPTEINSTHCGICKGLDTYVSILGRPTISMAHMV